MESFGLGQYDRSNYDRSIKYVEQLILNNRNEFAQIKGQISEEDAQGAFASDIESASKSRERIAKAYAGLNFCLRTQRLLLRPSDEAWIYCKKESKLKGE